MKKGFGLMEMAITLAIVGVIALCIYACIRQYKLMKESEVIRTQAVITKTWTTTTANNIYGNEGQVVSVYMTTDYHISYRTEYAKYCGNEKISLFEWSKLSAGNIIDVTLWDHPEEGIVAAKITSFKSKKQW